MNLSTFLSYSMRFLNIANRAIPLIKEVNPTIKVVKNTFNKMRKSTTPKNIVSEPQELPYREKRYPQNSTLTFFQ